MEGGLVEVEDIAGVDFVFVGFDGGIVAVRDDETALVDEGIKIAGDRNTHEVLFITEQRLID